MHRVDASRSKHPSTQAHANTFFTFFSPTLSRSYFRFGMHAADSTV